jgi:hypothetical protein
MFLYWFFETVRRPLCEVHFDEAYILVFWIYHCMTSRRILLPANKVTTSAVSLVLHLIQYYLQSIMYV